MKVCVKINGTSVHCHQALIPLEPGPNGNTAYPDGTCPYFRQFPNGDEPFCLLFRTDPRSKRLLERSENGYALRLPECRLAEDCSRQQGEVVIEIVAADRTCEMVPILELNDKRPPVTCVNVTMGSPVLYFPNQVCRYYTQYPNGSTWCQLPGFGRLFSRQADGYTRRLSICLTAEEHARRSESDESS